MLDPRTSAKVLTVSDLNTQGGPGPDRGKRGKYLIVPAGHKGALPKDKKDAGEYFIARSPSNVNWLILRWGPSPVSFAVLGLRTTRRPFRGS
ncbi:DUF1254 domain-containing protein [Bradyrhizobium lupini]|uniref:DUF1254 domain-containing protein n=1 Tax=Rhizobium lupini TaxID=136996 RepID=UPI0034C6C3DB